MAHDDHADHVDKTALTFVIVMTIFIAVLAYTIFPRHEAPTPAGGSGPSTSGTKK